METESADICRWIWCHFGDSHGDSHALEAILELPTRANYVVPGSCSENPCGGCIRRVPDATSDVVKLGSVE